MVASVGPEWAFLVDALSHVPMIFVLRAIRTEPPQSAVRERTLRTGIATIARHGALAAGSCWPRS